MLRGFFEGLPTALERNVAIKVLADAFVNDRERLSRFQREAKLLAALNHPGIATLHGLEESGPTHFIVMELVEGPILNGARRREPDGRQRRRG